MSADPNNYDLQNVQCQSLVPSCKVSRSPKRAVANLTDILGVACGCVQQWPPACDVVHGCETMFSGGTGL